MSDQDLLAQMSELAAQEDALRASEKQGQFEAILTMQAQLAALIHIFRSKGILSEDDVKGWEKNSEVIGSMMRDLLTFNRERESAGTAIEVYAATKKGLLIAKELNAILGGDAEKIDQQLQALDEAWAQYETERTSHDPSSGV